MIDDVTDVINDVTDVIDDVTDVINDVTDMINDVTDVIDDVTDVINDVIHTTLADLSASDRSRSPSLGINTSFTTSNGFWRKNVRMSKLTSN